MTQSHWYFQSPDDRALQVTRQVLREIDEARMDEVNKG